MEKRNIAIVAGGNSSEYKVSVKSAVNVFNAVDREKFTPWMVHMKHGEWHVIVDGEQVASVNKSDFSFEYVNHKVKFEYAYIIIHGTPGEDGLLQGYFEVMGIPYSTCNTCSSALTFNKFFCNNYLRNFDIKIAKSDILSKESNYSISEIVDKLDTPLFVKPNAGGSSFGVTKVKKAEDLSAAIKKAFTEGNEVLIEEYIEGKELTCGVMKVGNKKTIFPVTEVLPKNEFFNYEAKYIPGMADEITPAQISGELTEEVQRVSSKIYDLCNCNGIVRIDYILRKDEIFFLEVNTVPGMTETSFIPQQINAMGATLKEVITNIIETGLEQNS